MERYNITAEVREETGKGVARKLRRKGLVPAVVYGRKRDPQPLTIDPMELQSKVGGNAIFDLNLKGDEEETETVMIKEVQKDPIKGNILHIDFLHISMDEKITISVPISLTGDAPGVREGGVLQQLMREIELECYPADIPEEIELDLSELGLGGSLTVGDVEVPEGAEIITPLDETIVTVVAPTEIVEEEEVVEEDEFAEPEVIGEEDEEEAQEEEAEEEE